MSFTLAITGRPNVGKSTFFNRLLEQRKAIVDRLRTETRVPVQLFGTSADGFLEAGEIQNTNGHDSNSEKGM